MFILCYFYLLLGFSTTDNFFFTYFSRFIYIIILFSLDFFLLSFLIFPFIFLLELKIKNEEESFKNKNSYPRFQQSDFFLTSAPFLQLGRISQLITYTIKIDAPIERLDHVIITVFPKVRKQITKTILSCLTWYCYWVEQGCLFSLPCFPIFKNLSRSHGFIDCSIDSFQFYIFLLVIFLYSLHFVFSLPTFPLELINIL